MFETMWTVTLCSKLVFWWVLFCIFKETHYENIFSTKKLEHSKRLFNGLILSYFKTLTWGQEKILVDLKCGFIQIILSEDDCFAGAINSKDAGFGKILEKNCRMNLGRFMLTILLYKVCCKYFLFDLGRTYIWIG